RGHGAGSGRARGAHANQQPAHHGPVLLRHRHAPEDGADRLLTLDRGDPPEHRRGQPGLPLPRGPADRGRRRRRPAPLHGLLLRPLPGGGLPGRGLAAQAVREGAGVIANVRLRLVSAAVLSVVLAVSLDAAETPGPIAWTDWSDAAFERARADDRLVLLDLGAVWCHWCHVMEETTY